MTRKELWYWLLSLETIGTAAIQRLIAQCGSLEEFWEVQNPALTPRQAAEFFSSRKRQDDYRRGYESLSLMGIHLVTADEEDYPSRLRNLPGSPLGLFVKGKLPKEISPTVAIVGARKCTSRGRNLAEEYAQKLAEWGIAIISGMAEGIDGGGHLGALRANGDTFAILGCGVDLCYPSFHRDLYQQLCEKGGVISEFPPGSPPMPNHFPRRNRVISGLADLLLVVEAREKSGSLITVDYALEQGKDVMAIPGRPSDPLSIGCNRLIQEGAQLCTSPEDILAHFQKENPELPSRNKEEKLSHKEEAMFSPEEIVVLHHLGSEAKHIDQLAEETGLEVGRLLAMLLELELKNQVQQKSFGQYQRKQ